MVEQPAVHGAHAAQAQPRDPARTGYAAERSAWIPVLGSWTSSRDFDVIAPYRFRTWLAEHNAARAKERAEAHDDQDQKGGA